jgi:ABC-type multidrug transport system fused ATPase/permease subunit
MDKIEISYYKNKYPLAYKLLSKLIPFLSLFLIFLVLFSGYLSIFYPKSFWFIVLFIIIVSFYVWWLIRWFEYIFLLLTGYSRFKSYQKIIFENIFNEKPNSKVEQKFFSLYKNSSLKEKDIIHWVIIPTFQDPYEMLKDSFDSIKNSKFDNKKIIITLAWEQADEENFKNISEKILNEYKEKFLFINTTLHPKWIEGEIPGKGSNISYSAKQTYKKILDLGYKPEQVLVSVLDSESIVQDKYFQALTLEYCITEDNMKDKTIYQPMLFLFNRFFESPFFSKVVALATTFYILAASVKGVGARAQAVQAQSLKSLLETNFYSVETITEDGHQYYRTYCAFNGKFQIKPVYTYVLLEPVIWKNIFESIKLQYNQIKRWAHWVLDFPYIVLCFWENKQKLPKLRTLYEIFRLMEVSTLWSSLQFILFMWTIYFSIIGAQYANLLKYITFLSFIVLVFVLLITLFFLPWYKLSKIYRIYEASKYILFSLTIMWPLLFVLNWLPALHAQMLILIWKPMGKFNVTKKYRRWQKI